MTVHAVSKVTMQGCLGWEGSKYGSSAGECESEDIEVAAGEDPGHFARAVHAVHHLPASPITS